jgi:hypothetical protein
MPQTTQSPEDELRTQFRALLGEYFFKSGGDLKKAKKLAMEQIRRGFETVYWHFEQEVWKGGVHKK